MVLTKEQNKRRMQIKRAEQKAKEAAAPQNYVQRPAQRAPKHHYWDGQPPGVWRHVDTDALYVPAAHARQRRSNNHRRRVQSGRWRRVNAARCQGELFTPGFDVDRVNPLHVGMLGDETCHHCEALLYKGEAVAIKGGGGLKRGRHCCCEGQVELPRTKRQPAVARSGATAGQMASSFATTRGSSTTPSPWRRRCTRRWRSQAGSRAS